MKKIVLLLFFILVISAGVCYAQDIYVGQINDENGEYAAYVRTDSVHGICEMKKGNATASLTISYSLILTPTDATLTRVRSMMQDNRIAYRVDNYKIVSYYDMVNKSVMPDLELYLVNRYFSAADDHYLYSAGDVNNNVITTYTDDAVPEAAEKACIYAVDHKETVIQFKSPED